jgi:hypothetical protein
MMAVTRQFDPAIPHRLVLTVPVPLRLFTRNIGQKVDMFSSRLRFLLAQQYQAQIQQRTLARYEARDARAAALKAAARQAEAAEAA